MEAELRCYPGQSDASPMDNPIAFEALLHCPLCSGSGRLDKDDLRRYLGTESHSKAKALKPEQAFHRLLRGSQRRLALVESGSLRSKLAKVEEQNRFLQSEVKRLHARIAEWQRRKKRVQKTAKRAIHSGRELGEKGRLAA